MTARIVLPEERIAEAKPAAASGEKHEPTFRVDIVDAGGVTVADVEKILYIPRRRIDR